MNSDECQGLMITVAGEALTALRRLAAIHETSPLEEVGHAIKPPPGQSHEPIGAEAMTDQELARHVTVYDEQVDWTYCGECFEDWPCAAVAKDAIERLISEMPR